MNDKVTAIKAEIFDILLEQDQLNFRINQLEELKKQKLQELGEAINEASIPVETQPE